jgi:hypothetical protein
LRVHFAKRAPWPDIVRQARDITQRKDRSDHD